MVFNNISINNLVIGALIVGCILFYAARAVESPLQIFIAAGTIMAIIVIAGRANG